MKFADKVIVKETGLHAIIIDIGYYKETKIPLVCLVRFEDNTTDWYDVKDLMKGN